ncbi:MAG: ABC transporter substrate binding protein [Desulfopila sp.]|nr:ABC transporter substrate binding protein [Desulfopila sp.]
MSVRVIVGFLLLLLVDPGFSNGEKLKKNVLYINSYHHGYQWSDEIHEGIRTVLRNSDYKIDLQIEYMDTKKYLYDPVNQSLFKLYKEKFANEDFDVIIVSDNHAYNFVIEHREVLFQDIPLVFCGMNNFEAADVSSGNLTGVVETFDLVNTLDVARKLHPGKTRMVVVGDQSITGRSIAQQIYTMLDRYDVPLEVEFWLKLTLEESKQRVENLSQDTFLFFAPWYQTVKGKFYTAEEVMQEIYAHSSVPIYTTWEFLLGHGAVGGRLLSGRHHGEIAAQMALRILGGERAEDIPVLTEPSGLYKFDYNVMQKLNINPKLLPEGSIIINSPKAFYEMPKELFWTIVASFLMLLTVLIFLMITMAERRRVQRKVQEQLSFQETLMDTIPQLVSWKDTSGKYLGANQTFTEFFGIDTPNGMISKTTEGVIKDSEYVQWSVEKDRAVVLEEEEFRKVRRKIIDSKGSVSWLEINKVPLRDQADRIIGVLTTAENVTKEQNLEKQLLQSQKMEAIGTLAGGIAHDFNNILTSILNSTELALGDVDENSQTAKDLKRVLKAAGRGSSVVKQILSFSKPSQEGFRPTDLAAVCHEVLSLMDASLPSNIHVHSNITASGILVDADPSQVHQVILNLCTNAFHALQKKGGTLLIQVEDAEVSEALADLMSVSPGKFMKITVADDGIGIDSEILDNIFDPFFSTKDITEGTGLGLSVVHGIVKGHRGGIRVESKPGEGSRFELYLPQSKSTNIEEQEIFETGAAEYLSILFVEDDEDQLNSVPRVLQNLGHRVIALDDPHKAIEMVEQEMDVFDIVISDYDMPAMRGTELAAKIPGVPCILVSGRNDAVSAAMECPSIRKVLIKPYDKQDLKRAINLVYRPE